MMFIFFGFSLLHHLLLLTATVPYMWRWRRSFTRSTEFIWLVAFPVVIVSFAVLAGLLCKLVICVCVAFFGGQVCSLWLLTLSSCDSIAGLLSLCTCMHFHIAHTQTCKCIHLHTCKHTHMHVYTCNHMHTHIHTWTHTYTPHFSLFQLQTTYLNFSPSLWQLVGLPLSPQLARH